MNTEISNIWDQVYRIKSLLSFTYYVDIDAGGTMDAFFVKAPYESEVAWVGRKSDRAVMLLESEVDVALFLWLAEDTQNANRVAYPHVLAHEQVGCGRTVLQEASRIPYYCK